MFVVKDLKNDIVRLISLYEKERAAAGEFSQRLREEEIRSAQYRKQIAELKTQVDQLKLAGALTGGIEPSASRERIDKLIREIDRCIGLLSN